MIGSDPDDSSIPFEELKNTNVQFRAYYYIYDSSLIPKAQLVTLRGLGRKNGGIRLYRNGFRVLPYGEEGNDWINLDASTTKRSILPAHSNNNFFGFVQINDQDKVFNETSSREGLMENEAFLELRNFLYRSIVSAVIRVAEARNVKLVSGQQKTVDGKWDYSSVDVRIKNIAFTLDALEEALEERKGGVETRKKRKSRIRTVKKEIKKLQEARRLEQKQHLEEKSTLRVLSSVGLTIAQFIHEIKHHINDVRSDIKFLMDHLVGQTELLNRTLILDRNFTLFHTYTSYYDRVVSQNVVRELQPLEIRSIVRPFIRSVEQDAIKSGITIVEPQFHGYGHFTVPMHPSEWSSILFNFYTNSKKALADVNRGKMILIETGVEGKNIYLEFSDTGKGIPDGTESEIFNEFYTTTNQSGFSEVEDISYIGTGLGLKIVKDIVSSYRGNVYVASPKEEYVTCIRVEIPKATEKQLSEYGL